MPTMLCIDFSGNQSKAVTQLAAASGLNIKSCGNAQEGLEYLNSSDNYVLMLVVNQENTNDDAGLNIIRSARLLANRATMPVILLMKDRDLELAHTALLAGATEVYLRAEIALLNNLMNEFSKPVPEIMQSGRMLLVEDDEFQADFITLLCQALGFTVDHCDSVDAGIELVNKHQYQFAVVDILLLGTQSGLSLLRYIRQMNVPQSSIPIMVISGFNDAARRVEALRLGADDYLSKPFSQEEFIWRLQRIMQDHSNHDHGKPSPTTSHLPKWKKYGLSSRESEICAELIRGISDKQIAIELNISFWTVRTHIGKVFNKLDVINRRELMARYIAS